MRSIPLDVPDPLGSLSGDSLGHRPDGRVPLRAFRPLPHPLLRTARRQIGLLSREQCTIAGVSKDRIRRLVQAGAWLCVTRDVFLVLPGLVAHDDWPNRLRQRAFVGALAAGSESVAVGHAALCLVGVQGSPLDYKPQFWLPPGRQDRERTGVRQWRGSFDRDSDAMLVENIWVAKPITALTHVLGAVDREVAVSLFDSALNLRVINSAEFVRLVDLMHSRPGVRHVRQWNQLADRRADSPLESRARLECLDAGLAPNDLQRVVLDERGTFIGRFDMTWDLGGGRLLIIEMDGAHHRQNGTARRDSAKDNALRRLGHVVYHLGWEDLGTGELVRTVRVELQRAGRLAA